MSRILGRFHRHQQAIDDTRKIGRILIESGGLPDTEQPKTFPRATLPGDSRRLRGIPVAGGACGTSPGTDPLHHVLHLSVRPGRYPPD
jgi:hypothetical protein